VTRKKRSNGEGSLFKRSSGTWCAQVSIDGKRVSKTFKLRRDAVNWLNNTSPVFVDRRKTEEVEKQICEYQARKRAEYEEKERLEILAHKLECEYWDAINQNTQHGERDYKAGYVYVIDAGEYIKIGFGVKPTQRLKDLQTGSPTKLKLLLCIKGNTKLERDLHKKFAAHRVEGEWFANKEQIINEIKNEYQFIAPEQLDERLARY